MPVGIKWGVGIAVYYREKAYDTIAIIRFDDDDEIFLLIVSSDRN